MVRANGANTNAEIHAPLSPIRRPEDRGSMHPPRPREAEWVVRWPWGSGGRAGRAEGGQALVALRATPTRIPRRGRGAALMRSEGADRLSADTGEPRRREGAADGASTICLANDHAQRFLVRTNDVVDEPLARGRMDH
jgi:hypothetical protein